MSVDPAPSKILGNGRRGFVKYLVNSTTVQFPTPPFYLVTSTNFEQVGGSENMYMGLSNSNGTGDIDVAFSEEQQPLVDEDNGYSLPFYVPAAAPQDPDGPGGWADLVTSSSERTLKFKFTVGQDANGNQPQQGAGVKIKNKLFVQTFNGTYADGLGNTVWDWTADTPTLSDVELTISATSVTWSSYSNYTATIYCTTEHTDTIWDAEFNYELRTGWFDPVDPDYYGTTATVTVRYLMDIDGTEPEWDTPEDAVTDILTTQKPFKGVEITPPQKGYV